MKNKIIGLVTLLLVLIVFLVVILTANDIKGTWIADGTQIPQIKEIKNGKPVYMDENPNPYYLIVKNSKNFSLELTDDTYEGTYSRNSKNKNEYIFSPKNNSSFTCKLNVDGELECDKFATIFVRK